MRLALLALLPLIAGLISPARAASPPSPAATPSTYQVNVIVFRNHLPALDGGEQWSQETFPPLRGLGRSVLPIPGLSDGSALAPALAKLSTNPDYTVLAAMNWLQPGVGYAQAVPTRIEDAAGNLDGVITVFKLLYLHADIDLAFAPHATIAGSSAEPTSGPGNTTPPAAVPTTAVGSASAASEPTIYRMIEHRRISANKVEYFDHPKFGVLLEVTPLNNPP